jgi:hypothetical protein
VATAKPKNLDALERLLAIARNINGEGGSMEKLVRELASPTELEAVDEERVRAYREGRQ